jgi:uncharacterized protein (TIGR01244 family)
MKRLKAAAALLVLAFCGSTFAAESVGLAYEKQPVENLTVSGQPTLQQLKTLKQKGFVTVINLRREGEFDEFDEAAEVAKLGMNYVHIPVRNVKSITADDANRLHEAIDHATGPVLLHCTVGWRAGSLWAIEQYLLHGASREDALTLVGKAHMSHAGDDVKDWLSKHERR